MQRAIKESFQRNARAVTLRPSVGQGTAVTDVSLIEGLRCEIRAGDWRLPVDLSTRSGGTGEAPDPGVYGRGALGACLAISIAQWAAHREVPIEALSVRVEADYDTRGTYGIGEVPADYTAVRYTVSLKSPAPEDAIRAVVRDAERHCIYLNVFARPRDVAREIRIER
jgi:uncharacterized OsmC-like protein